MGNRVYSLEASRKVLSTPETKTNREVLEKLLEEAEKLKLSEKDRVRVTIDRGGLWFSSVGLNNNYYIGTRTIAKLKRIYQEICQSYTPFAA